MAGLTGLAVRVGADITGYRKGMDEVTGTARKAAKEIPAAMAVVSASVIAIGSLAVDAATKYEEGMKKIRAGTGATGSALKALGEDARAVFRENDDTFSDVADTVANLNTRLGLTGPALQSVAGQILDLADITGEQLIPLTNAAAQVMQGWQVPTEKQAGLLDHLYKVSQTTGIGVTKLSELLVTNGATFRSMGLSVEESAALLGQWEKQGINSETVLAGLKIGVNNLEKAGIDAADGMAELQRVIREESEDAGRNAAITVVGTRAANDFFDAVKNGRFDITELTKALNENGDTIKAAAEEGKTSGEKMQEAWNKVTDSLVPLGLALTETLGGALEFITPLITGLGQIVTGLADGIKALVGLIDDFALSSGQAGDDFEERYTKRIKEAKEAVEQLTEAERENAANKQFLRTKQIEEDIKRQAEIVKELVGKTSSSGGSLAAVGAELGQQWVEASNKLASLKNELKEAQELIRIYRGEVAAAGDATEESGEKVEKAGEAAKKTRVDLSRLGKTQKEIASSADELRESWAAAGKQLRIDIAATGDQTRVLYLHRGALEPLIRSYREWGLALPPLLAEADRLFKIQDENARVNAELEKRLEGVTAELTQQELELQLVIPEWERYLPLYSQLAAAIRLVHAAQAEGGSVAADPATLVPPQSWFGKLGDAMGLAFQDGFAQSFRSNSDLKMAVQTGLGQAISAGLTAALGPAAANPIVASFIQVIGGSVGKWLGSSLFGEKLTNEQLAKGYGQEFAKQFGIAFNAEFEQALMQAASRIPAVRDRIDASVARFMPEMISHILAQVDSLTPQIQASLAQSIGHGVNYLMEKGGLSHKKAFEQFLPQFGEIVRQALAGGQALDQGILNLIEHARNLGVDFSELGSVFAGALEELLSGTEISAQGLRNLADMAAAVGVDIADVFAEALDDFIDSEDFSIEKMEQLAEAARAAGLDVSEALTDAIRDARAELEDLNATAREIGASILDAFIRKLDLKGAGQKLREEFVGGRTEGIEDEARLAAEREAAQARFNELKAKARAIDIDGKNDARDIREAIKGLPDDEAKIVLELAKQRLERREAREEIKRHRKEQKLVNEQIEAQNRLVAALENLFKNLDSPMERNKTTAEGFAGALGAAEAHLQGIKTIWEWIANHPLDLPKGGSDAGMFSTGSGAGVFTAGFGGGSAPTAQFGGQQQFSAPAAAAGGHGGPPIIIAPQVHIDAIDAKSLQERGVDIANAVATGVKRGLSQLDPSIVRGN
jgi:TP901 family phage tail tape measure protein